MIEGIHAIIQKISVDAQQDGNEYFEQRKKSIDEEINNENAVYLSELDKRREMLKKNNEYEYDRMLERMVSRLNRDILTYQHNLIDEIFDMAVLKLRDISEKDFAKMFRCAIKGLEGDFVLHLGELSKDRLDTAEIEKAVKEIENGGINIVLSGETIPKKSGFVIMDDRVEYNCLFEDLIDDKKNEQAAAILKEIFGDCENRLVV